jgi:hypothetical protein
VGVPYAEFQYVAAQAVPLHLSHGRKRDSLSGHATVGTVMRVPNQNFVSTGRNREQVFFAVGDRELYLQPVRENPSELWNCGSARTEAAF